MAIPCLILIPSREPESLITCGEPKWNGSPRYCYWHRIARTSPADQVKVARTRRDLKTMPQRLALSGINAGLSDRCVDCGWEIPLWYGTGVRVFRCNPCAKINGQDRRRENTFGVDPEGFAKLNDDQGGLCAICECNPRTRELALEHDHKTGLPRGLCCQQCNQHLLGGGQDSLRILRRAVAYLEAPPAQGAARWRRVLKDRGLE